MPIYQITEGIWTYVLQIEILIALLKHLSNYQVKIVIYILYLQWIF